MFPSRRLFTNDPSCSRSASSYHPSSVEAFQAKANVQPTSFSINLTAAAPASPAPSIPSSSNSELKPSEIKPILHKFSTEKHHPYKSQTSSSNDQLELKPAKDITADSKVVCVKDKSVINNAAMQGFGTGFLKGVERAAIEGNPKKIFSSALSGYISGRLTGELTAGETCVLALPKYDSPKP
jgi:hypothetical protein